jgi:hypothetical protein
VGRSHRPKIDRQDNSQSKQKTVVSQNTTAWNRNCLLFWSKWGHSLSSMGLRCPILSFCCSVLWNHCFLFALAIILSVNLRPMTSAHIILIFKLFLRKCGFFFIIYGVTSGTGITYHAGVHPYFLWGSCYSIFCHKYYECKKGSVVTPQMCRYPQLYSTQSNSCEDFKKVRCGSRKEYKTKCK